MELNKNILAFLREFTELMEKYKVIDMFINEDTHAINFSAAEFDINVACYDDETGITLVGDETGIKLVGD